MACVIDSFPSQALFTAVEACAPLCAGWVLRALCDPLADIPSLIEAVTIHPHSLWNAKDCRHARVPSSVVCPMHALGCHARHSEVRNLQIHGFDTSCQILPVLAPKRMFPNFPIDAFHILCPILSIFFGPSSSFCPIPRFVNTIFHNQFRPPFRGPMNPLWPISYSRNVSFRAS